MQTLVAFFSFETFISLEVLTAFYFLGAIVIPVFAFVFAVWLYKRLGRNTELVNTVASELWQQLDLKQKFWLSVAFVIGFIFMQLLWRMLFEFLIAFMQMHQVIVSQPL